MSLLPLPPDLDPRRPRRHARASSTAGVSLARLAKVVSAALSLLLIVYIGYLWTTVRGINDVQRLNIGGLGGAPVSQPSGSPSVAPLVDIDGQDQNILIVGNDDRSGMTDAQVNELKVGRDGGSLNTDTMMIVHVPADGSKATLISLPRDSYVDIPGYGMNRLNAAYSMAYRDASGSANAKRAAGAQKLIEVIKNLTGLTIDHFVQVSLLGFVNISDAIGGVQVNMCNAVNDTVSHNASIGLTGGSGLVLSKGRHTIQGVQALEFVRQREGLKHGDIDRTARQRYFLTAAFRAVASAGTLLDVGKLNNLINAVKKSIYVDQNLSMLELARQMSNLSANNIVGTVIPTDHYENVNLYGYESNVGIVIPTQVRAYVQKLVDGPTSPAYRNAKSGSPDDVTLTVRNQGSANGAAATATKTLRSAGFTATVDRTVATGTLASTTIEYPAGMESQAKTLAHYVPGAAVKQADVSGVTLILGADGVQATATPPSTTKSGSSASSASSATKKSKTAIDATCIN